MKNTPYPDMEIAKKNLVCRLYTKLRRRIERTKLRVSGHKNFFYVAKQIK